MKELHGQATAIVAAPQAECVTLLAAVDRYPEWYPDVVREVEVLERDRAGRPTKVEATLHVARGPLVRDFHLILAVMVDSTGTIKLTRLPREPAEKERFEVTWRLQSVRNGDSTEVTLALDANLDVPRLVPLGGIGDSMAQGFVGAASEALGSRPRH